MLHILIGILWEHLSADVLDENRGDFFEVMLCESHMLPHRTKLEHPSNPECLYSILLGDDSNKSNSCLDLVTCALTRYAPEVCTNRLKGDGRDEEKKLFGVIEGVDLIQIIRFIVGSPPPYSSYR